MKPFKRIFRKVKSFFTQEVYSPLNPILFKYFNTRGQFNIFQGKALPRKAIFNTVNICNANCVFCAYQYKRDESLTMDNELFLEFSRQYISMNPTGWITLSPTVGDPLVDAGLFKKIEALKKISSPQVQFYTNGILLKKNNNIDMILASSLDKLIISFPDFNEEEYNKIFRTQHYRVSLEGIHELLVKHREQDSSLNIGINLRPARSIEVIKEEHDFKKYIQPYLSSRVVLSYMKSFDNWTGLIKPGDLPAGMVLNKDLKQESPIPCRRLFDVMFLASGDVKLCGCRFNGSVYDDLIIGNIKDSSLEDIWFGEKAKMIREKFFDYEYPSVCKDCSLYKPILFHHVFSRKKNEKK